MRKTSVSILLPVIFACSLEIVELKQSPCGSPCSGPWCFAVRDPRKNSSAGIFPGFPVDPNISSAAPAEAVLALNGLAVMGKSCP
jgi:hypothetical protein